MKYTGVILQLVGLFLVSLDFFNIYNNKYFSVAGYLILAVGNLVLYGINRKKQ
jgi:hypothetical protein